MYHSARAVQRFRQCHNLYMALQTPGIQGICTAVWHWSSDELVISEDKSPLCRGNLVINSTVLYRSECIISYTAPSAVQYTNIALAAVLCSIAQVLAAETAMTPPHRSLKFFYSLTCKSQLRP